MVNYAAAADFSDHKKRKKYRSREEIEKRKAELNSRRNEDDWRQVARDVIYRQLAMIERSEYQLLQALRKRDVPEEIAKETIQKFVAAGLVDDFRFAQIYVRSQITTKCVSAKHLKFELQKHGVSRENIELALSQIDPAKEDASAIEFAKRKIAAMKNLDRAVIYRRLSGQLARRGFNPSQVRQAINAAFMDLDGSAPEE